MVHENENDSEIIEAMAEVVAHVGDTDFPAQVIAAVRAVAPFDSALFLGTVLSRAPQLLYDGLDEGERDAFYGAYLSGAYLLAPGYRAAQNADITGVRRLSDVFPGDLEDSQYFAIYWGQTGMIDELFMFVRLDQERSAFLALGRYGGAAPFSDDDVRRLGMVEPILRNAIQRHWRDLPFGADDAIKPDGGHERYRWLLTKFGSQELTPREYDVCQLMLRGHSSKSGARELGISPETERIHRGRVFQKLGVTSQVETLSLFLQSITDGSLSNRPSNCSADHPGKAD